MNRYQYRIKLDNYPDAPQLTVEDNADPEQAILIACALQFALGHIHETRADFAIALQGSNVVSLLGVTITRGQMMQGMLSELMADDERCRCAGVGA